MKCGFYEADITSFIGTHVPGQLVERLCTGIETPVYAKAAVFENNGRCAAVLELDAGLIIPEYSRRICDRITAMTDIKEDELVIGINHVHTSVPLNGETENEDDRIYVEYAVRRAADAVVIAYNNMRECKPYFAMGHVEGVSFVRDYLMKDGSLRTNPGVGNPDIVRPLDEIDPDLPLLLFKTPEGEPIGCVSCFANHQDCIGPRITQINGDYCGVMSRELKKAFGAGFVNVFMIGTAGNINHVNVYDAAEQKGADGSVPKKSRNNYLTVGTRLAEEAVKMLKEAKPLASDELKVFRTYVKGYINMPSDKEADEARKFGSVDEETLPAGRARYRVRMARRLADFYDEFKDKKQVYDMPLTLIRVGEAALVTLPCEIYVAFGRRIKQAADTDKIMVAEFCTGDAYWSYVPEKELFGSDLYETYLGTSNYKPDTGDRLTEAAIELFKK